MPPKLASSVTKLTKQKIIPCTVVDVLGNLCSVRLSDTGKLLRGLRFMGTSPNVGSLAYVDYRSGTPVVHTTNANVDSSITSAENRITTSVSQTSRRPPAEPNNPGGYHNDMAGIQGGLAVTPSAPAEYYHLTEEEYDELMEDAPEDGNQYVRKDGDWEAITDLGEIQFPNIIHWWKLDEESGTRVDSHGSKNLSAQNSPGYATGKLGNGMDSESSSTAQGAYHNDSLGAETNGDFSISFWIKPESHGDMRSVIHSKTDSDWENGDWIIFQENYDDLFVYFRYGGTWIGWKKTSVFTNGTWRHVVVTANAARSSITIYTDSSSGKSSDSRALNSGFSTGFRIAAGSSTDRSRCYDGILDEVAIFDTILTQDQVDLLYNSGSGLSYEIASSPDEAHYTYTPEAPIDGKLYGRKDEAWEEITDLLNAEDIDYIPAVEEDWNGSADPGNIDDALDQLAERITDIEGSPGTPHNILSEIHPDTNAVAPNDGDVLTWNNDEEYWEPVAPTGGAPEDHDHSGDEGDGGQFDVANLSSGAATEGQIPTADGAGNITWEDPVVPETNTLTILEVQVFS